MTSVSIRQVDANGDATAGAQAAPLPYPRRSDYRNKGVQPHFWPDKDDIAAHNAGWRVHEPRLGGLGAERQNSLIMQVS
ncbi:hypothetical protein SLV14_007055 [Streptomyces sp. Je 1-4]|uniref:hypothetical protein n=1 Tax=Streptomyces TaxID=1883 RepID=UPI0021D971A6|nr:MULTISPECIES: hypothetical protein [unclassified Streptomyces]UYB44002.1 hypothetical protein SLV14_007055 [Streptomyces sp. Je 1-4]UZQ40431.1 hypothetical protein SLV14N_007055 [Streptomyces sp. Je 1-4] [Streptomyces sp. Je 1-4 4N24]UZQ47848.1 hypothetical protein SLV14NA_007055 [Streptomyces sp. Je 1-4] [Streptomyces sp. Je 1-4 4N24_ara]